MALRTSFNRCDRYTNRPVINIHYFSVISMALAFSLRSFPVWLIGSVMWCNNTEHVLLCIDLVK
jgi:hypothetical protein